MLLLPIRFSVSRIVSDSQSMVGVETVVDWWDGGDGLTRDTRPNKLPMQPRSNRYQLIQSQGLRSN